MHIVYLIYQKFRTTYIDLSSQMSSFSRKVEDVILVTTCSTGYQNLLEYSIYPIHWCISSHFELIMAPICHLHAQQGGIASHHESTCRAACTSFTWTARRQTLYPETWPALIASHQSLTANSQLVSAPRKYLISMLVWHSSLATIFAISLLKIKIMGHIWYYRYSHGMHQVRST